MPRSLTPDTIRTFLSRLTSSSNTSTPNASSDHLDANLESIKQKSRVSAPSRASFDAIRSAFKRNAAQQQSPSAPVLRLQLPPDSSSPLSTVANTPKASLDVPRSSPHPHRTSLEDSGEMRPPRPSRPPPPPPIPSQSTTPVASPPISVTTSTTTLPAKPTNSTPSGSPISARPPSLRLTPSLVLRPPLPIRNLPALPPISTSSANDATPSQEFAGATRPANVVRLASVPALMHDGERDEGWDGDGDPEDDGEADGEAMDDLETGTGESGDSPRDSEHSSEESVYFDANHGTASAGPSPTTSSFVRPPAPGFAQAIARRASTSPTGPHSPIFTAPSIPIPRRESLGFAPPTPSHSRFSTVSSSANGGNRESAYFTPRQSWAFPSSTSSPHASWLFPAPSPAPQAEDTPRRGTITRLPSVDDTAEPAGDEILSESLGLSLTPPASESLPEPSGGTTPAPLVPTPMSWVWLPGSNATPGPGPSSAEAAAASTQFTAAVPALGTDSPSMRRRSKAPDYFSLFPMHAHQNSTRTPRPSDFAGLSPNGGSSRPSLFHQASKSMVDLSAFSPPSSSQDIAASPLAPAQPLMTPTLHRRVSMPELSIPPPPYPRGPSPREDEGREQLPQYSNAIKLSGYMPRKMEYSAPGVLARDRSWRKVYCVLEGTIFRVYKVSTLESVFGGSRLGHHAKNKTGSSLGSLKEVVAAGASAAAVATGAGRYGLQQTPSRASTSGSSTGGSSPSTSGSTSASTAASSTLSIPVPRPSTPPTDLDAKVSPASAVSTSSPRRSSSSRRSSSPVRTSTSSHRPSFNLSSRPTLITASPEKEHVPAPGSLIHAYTLQNAESGLGTDYLKRRNVIRVRMEGQQFLLQASDLSETVDWIEGFQAAAGIALDLDERPMPKGAQFPRRRRRRRPRPSETAATNENASANANAATATAAATTASAS